MAVDPESSSSVVGQLIAGIVVFLSAATAILTQFLKGRREDPPREKLIVEDFDVADMRPIRELGPLVRELGPKLDRIFGIETELKDDMRDVLARLEKIEREVDFQRRLQEREERRQERP